MYLYKIDPKTKKKYRITVPDWDFPNAGYIASSNGVFNPTFLDANTGKYYQLYATSSGTNETYGITAIGSTPTTSSLDAVLLQDTVNNNWYTLAISGSLGNEKLYVISASVVPPNGHQTYVTLYDSVQGNYYQLQLSASAVSMSWNGISNP
jgi:hypothetical protein